jgi:hypothetical protein
MLKGFENITFELSKNEIKNQLPIIVKSLKKAKGQKNALTSNNLISILANEGEHTTGPRIRKMINNIRCKNVIPCLLSSSKGYWVSKDIDEVKDYVTSLQQREKEIKKVRLSIQKQIKERA